MASSAKSALEILTDDRKALEQDKEVVKSLDAMLNKERKLAFDDEVLLSKKTEAFLKALQKGDDAAVAALKAEIKVIQARYDAEEKEIIAIKEKETKAVEVEQALLAKVKSDEKTELAEEETADLKAEIEATEAAVSSESASFLAKIFGGK